MRDINHKTPGKFNWRCLLGHAWGEWSRTMVRPYPAPSLDDFLWKQRKCTRCGCMHGIETPSIEK